MNLAANTPSGPTRYFALRAGHVSYLACSRCGRPIRYSTLLSGARRHHRLIIAEVPNGYCWIGPAHSLVKMRFISEWGAVEVQVRRRGIGRSNLRAASVTTRGACDPNSPRSSLFVNLAPGPELKPVVLPGPKLSYAPLPWSDKGRSPPVAPSPPRQPSR
jgi:hypothetical protein